MSQEIHYGLVGLTVDTTQLSTVEEETNSLIYRGYPVTELCDLANFEQTAYLLLYGDLPSKRQYHDFTSRERARRHIGPDVIELLRMGAKHGHPMERLRTAVSYLGQKEDDDTPDIEKSQNLLARIPTIVAADFRLAKGQDPIAPREDLGFAENFFHMCFDKVPAPDIVKCFDISLILYAEHSFNASTFTARVIASSLSDMYSAITGAIGSLKGPLHGGANEAVMHMMQEIGDPEKARAWMLQALADKRKIMGFGHRVYRHGDSRVPTMKQALAKVARLTDGEKWVKMSDILEETMVAQKGIYPNLDFPTGPAYYLMGFDIPVFTPIFVMSRITGWCGHVMEQLDDNKLIRPLSAYAGPPIRHVEPLDKRS